MWLTVVVVAVTVVGYGVVSEANPSPDSGVDVSGTVMTRTATSTSTVATNSSTSTVATTSSTSTVPSTTTPATSTTSVTMEAIVWEPGTVTCAELEGNVPYGLDDIGYGFVPGVIRTYWGPDNRPLTLQYLDDPTCTIDSDAWRYVIKNVLVGIVSHDNGESCDFYLGLSRSENPPRNLGTVMSLAAPICLDQW